MSDGLIVRRGGISEKAFAFIIVTYPQGSKCTAENGAKTIIADDTTGYFVFQIPNNGTFPQTWTIKAFDGDTYETSEEKVEQDVSVSTHGESISITLSYLLPPEYQHVEYLKSTGTQRIDTGLLFDYRQTFIFEACYEDITAAVLIGSIEYDQSSSNGILIAPTKEESQYRFGNIKSFLSIDSFSPDHINIYNYTVDRSGITRDGTSVLTYNATSGHGNTATIYLFGTHTGDYNDPNAKIGRFKILDENNVALIDLVPCYLKATNQAGMYDIVSNSFKTNVGTGTFIVGGDV